MKIATWNVERLKHKKSLDEISAVCKGLQADILVLTETDEQICPDYRYRFHTPTPPQLIRFKHEEPIRYMPTEHRVSIYTNYPCTRQYAAFDQYTSLCLSLETEIGALLIYGTIIGVLGNRHPSFLYDLKKQMADLYKFSGCGAGFCICGDFNCSFADNYYFTKEGRSLILQSFAKNHIKLQFEEWNLNHTLSDHKGVSVYFSDQ